MQPRITSCVCWPSARRLKGTRPALEEMETWQDRDLIGGPVFDPQGLRHPQGILIGQGYNVSIADEGARYTEKERRHACHSSLKDFTTTMTETQGGTGGDMHNFDNWDVPLTFNDGRLPNEVDFWNYEEPSWIHDDTSTGPSAQSASSPPEGPQPQASQQPQGSTIQPKKMPRSSTGGGASSSTHAAFRSGPGTTPQDQAEPEKDENWTPTEDWMKRKKPSTVGVRLHAAEDYAHQEQRIAFLRSGRDFVLSTIEGPHTTHKYGTNLIWKQYLRRLTFHAALSFNMLTEGQLDSHMINESDYEWLKLYHHIITHRICQMQRISSDGGLGNVDIGH